MTSKLTSLLLSFMNWITWYVQSVHLADSSVAILSWYSSSSSYPCVHSLMDSLYPRALSSSHPALCSSANAPCNPSLSHLCSSTCPCVLSIRLAFCCSLICSQSYAFSSFTLISLVDTQQKAIFDAPCCFLCLTKPSLTSDWRMVRNLPRSQDWSLAHSSSSFWVQSSSSWERKQSRMVNLWSSLFYGVGSMVIGCRGSEWEISVRASISRG
ncbi:hypothetical protein FGO68_gene2804 [Halteria grandinella]|uniref:Secreted protein n=1 Tax=Halteria grandinella TaxID=5974 RepID=A0A8J8NLN5_HALGN|nr:hypothetical protein FGO68_gene2804 [Halteria grandinella]